MPEFRCLGILVGLWEGEGTQAWVWIAMVMEVDGRYHGSTLLPRDLCVIQLHVVEYRVANVQHSADDFYYRSYFQRRFPVSIFPFPVRPTQGSVVRLMFRCHTTCLQCGVP
jgi:hypothetical protein